ncbi:carbohydrate-binding module family 13 protein [Agrocybe pediades]|nr:carbohydrate-binding module family 13 protein [Agrocybe pediades]
MALNITSGARYYIINTLSQTALDLSGNDKQSVIGYNVHHGENQQWEVTYFEGQEGEIPGWHIKSVSSGKYPRFTGEAVDGAAVVATEEPFVWHLWPDNLNIKAGRICVPSTALNVDLSDNAKPAPSGSPVVVWGRWDGKNQVWEFKKV